MSEYIAIPRQDMLSFLTERGFKEVTDLPASEVVYGRVIKTDVCLRVYTSLSKYGDLDTVRGRGADAIRLLVVRRYHSPERVVPIMKKAWKVYRVKGWRENLQRDIGVLVEHYALHTVSTKP